MLNDDMKLNFSFTGQIPIVPLNFSVLSNGTNYDRNTVELCIKEIIQAMSRLLASSGNIQFDFHHIGRLLIAESKVKMRFFREFISSLDSSGELEHAFRPDTAFSTLSIMTNPSTPRSGTALVLPKIVEPKGTDALNLECAASASSPRPDNLETKLVPEGSFVGESKSTDGHRDTSSAPNTSRESSKLTPLTDRPSTGSHQLVPKPAVLFDVADLNKTPAPLKKPKSAVHSSRGSARKHSAEESLPSSRPSTCSHVSNSGQDLCYLCHQRALRNVFIDLSEEKRKREIEEDKLLQAHQQQKDLVAQVKEQLLKEDKKLHNRDIASFNSTAAQRTKVQCTCMIVHAGYVYMYIVLYCKE